MPVVSPPDETYSITNVQLQPRVDILSNWLQQSSIITGILNTRIGTTSADVEVAGGDRLPRAFNEPRLSVHWCSRAQVQRQRALYLQSLPHLFEMKALTLKCQANCNSAG